MSFPIGVWNQPPENFAAWKARGCSFAMGMDNGTAARFGPATFSQRAADAGLQVMLNTADMRPPNLLAWFVPIDEPNEHGTPIEKIKLWVGRFTALDPTVPIVISLGGDKITMSNEQPDYYRALADLSPMVTLAPDWYVCNRNPDRYLGLFLPEGLNGTAVRKLREWCPRTTVWMFAECSYQGLNHAPDAVPREPTADEMEAQIKQGIAAGAKGLIYFPTATGPHSPFNWPERYDPPTSTDIPKRMVAIAQRLNPEAPPEPGPPVVEYATKAELAAVAAELAALTKRLNGMVAGGMPSAAAPATSPL